jgi:hypothetical protein
LYLGLLSVAGAEPNGGSCDQPDNDIIEHLGIIIEVDWMLAPASGIAQIGCKSMKLIGAQAA